MTNSFYGDVEQRGEQHLGRWRTALGKLANSGTFRTPGRWRIAGFACTGRQKKGTPQQRQKKNPQITRFFFLHQSSLNFELSL